MSANTIVVGAFAGAFGVRGETRIKSFCAEPEAIANYTPLTLEDGRTITTMVLTGRAKGVLTARVDLVTTKEQADALKGTSIYADRVHLPLPEDDEFYHADLIGLDVFDTGGAHVGTVKSVENHGATDLLEIVGSELGEGILLPFTTNVVPTVDLTSRRIVINPPDGLW